MRKIGGWLFNTVLLNEQWGYVEKYPTFIGNCISSTTKEKLTQALDAHKRHWLIIPDTEVVFFDTIKTRWFRQEFIEWDNLQLKDLKWKLLIAMKRQLTSWFNMQNEEWICMDVLWLPTRKKYGHNIARALFGGKRNEAIMLSNRIIKWDIPYYVDISTHWVGTIFSPKASPIWYVVNQVHLSVADYINWL